MSLNYPAVKKVKATDNFELLLTFSNGEERLFDMKPHLKKGIFRELKNLTLFKSVHISFDSVEWDNDADFDPEVLYTLGKKIKKPGATSSRSRVSAAAERKVSYRKK